MYASTLRSRAARTSSTSPYRAPQGGCTEPVQSRRCPPWLLTFAQQGMRATRNTNECKRTLVDNQLEPFGQAIVVQLERVSLLRREGKCPNRDPILVGHEEHSQGSRSASSTLDPA